MKSRAAARRIGAGNRSILLVGASLFLVAGYLSPLLCPTPGFAAEPGSKAKPKELTAEALPAEALPAEATPEFDPYAKKELPSLHVVDEQGDPVAKFKIKAWTFGLGNSTWHSGSDGKIAAEELLSAVHRAPAIVLTVEADGFASTLHRFFGPELEKLKAGEATLVMHRGEEVEISFRLPPGMTWPKNVKPELYFFALEDTVRALAKDPQRRKPGSQQDDNMLNVRFRGPGAATVRISAESAPFCVAVHAPGFLQFFERGPFHAARIIKDGKLEIPVDKPASLDVEFDLGDTQKLPFAGAMILLQWKNPATNRHLEIARTEGLKPKQFLKLVELPPGEYLATVTAHVKPGTTHSPPFTASQKIQLAPGQSETIDIPFTPPDPNAFRGDRTAILHILKPDGSPLTGEKVTVIYADEHYALPVFSDTISDSGTLTLAGITDRKPEGKKGDPYAVVAAGKHLGRFGFATDTDKAEFTFRVPAVVGDIAPDVPLVKIAGGGPAKLSDFRGKVVLVEFWATWCGPCQEPMGKMNQMVVDKPDVWKSQAVIVPISIDDNTELVTAHVARRGWTNLDYFWSGNDGVGGWQSPAPQAFGVNGVPTSFILDRNGKILWTGHPANSTGGKTLETRIEEAIAQ